MRAVARKSALLAGLATMLAAGSASAGGLNLHVRLLRRRDRLLLRARPGLHAVPRQQGAVLERDRLLFGEMPSRQVQGRLSVRSFFQGSTPPGPFATASNRASPLPRKDMGPPSTTTWS